MYRALRVIARTTPSRTPASTTSAIRAFSASSRSLSGHGPPQIYGSGLKNPEGIPSDEEQATGLERYQLLGKMEGVDVFDMQPLDSSRLGTLTDPIKVPSLFNERIIGCSGAPADSHDTIWIVCDATKRNNLHRCPECGSVYSIDNQGGHAEHDAHHH